MKNEFFKDTRLLEALDYIDDDLIGEVSDKLRVPSASDSMGRPREKKSPLNALHQIAALVACAVLMSALIPVFSLLLGNLIPPVTDSTAADGVDSNNEIDTDTAVKEYCTVTVKGEHVLYSGKIAKRVEKGVGFMLDSDDITNDILLEGYEIVSANVTMGGEVIDDVFDKANNALLIEKVTGDTVIDLTTQKIKLTIILFIDGVEVDKQIIEYGEKYEYVYYFDENRILSSFGGGSTGLNRPEHDMDNMNHTITFTIKEVKDNSVMKYNIKYAKEEGEFGKGGRQ